MAGGLDFHKRLGSGYFGEVWLATDTGLNAERAFKLIAPDKVPNRNNFFHEARILKAVEHPNIVRVHEAGIHSGRIYIAMEYLQRGSLEDEAKGAYVPLTRAKRLIIDVMRGLEHAHSQGILHRDIKPANILVGEGGEGKLSDFGLAIPMGIDPTALGMKDYNYLIHQAPEIVRTTDYYIGTDIYACGVTLYRLVNGDSVLPTVPVNEIRGLTQDGKFPDHTRYRDFVPRPLRVIINRAMNVDPSRRFQSASEMRHAVEQVKIEKNWSERILMNGVEWTCGWNRKCYEVSRRCGPNNRWEVLVQKGTAKRALRKIGALCRYDTTEAEAERHARRVLKDFVLGKQK